MLYHGSYLVLLHVSMKNLDAFGKHLDKEWYYSVKKCKNCASLSGVRELPSLAHCSLVLCKSPMVCVGKKFATTLLKTVSQQDTPLPSCTLPSSGNSTHAMPADDCLLLFLPVSLKTLSSGCTTEQRLLSTSVPSLAAVRSDDL